MLMPGMPGSVAPMASQPGAVRWTNIRSAGFWISRCGSLARIGIPVADFEGPITQLLLPRSKFDPLSRALATRAWKPVGGGNGNARAAPAAAEGASENFHQ